jgi:hypothetical protein
MFRRSHTSVQHITRDLHDMHERLARHAEDMRIAHEAHEAARVAAEVEHKLAITVSTKIRELLS